MDPKKLSSVFSLSYERIQRALKNLERMGLISIGPSSIEVIRDKLHLPRESKLFFPWSNQLKVAGLQKMNQLDLEVPVSYCAVFTCDEEAKNKIHSEFLQFLKKAEEIASNSKTKKTYQLSMDFFPWT